MLNEWAVWRSGGSVGSTIRHYPVDKCESFHSLPVHFTFQHLQMRSLFVPAQWSSDPNIYTNAMRAEGDAWPYCNFQKTGCTGQNLKWSASLSIDKKNITIELPVRLFHFNLCSISVSRVPWRTSPAAPGRRCTSYTSGDVPADQQRNGSCLDSWCPAAIFCCLLMLLSLLNCWESFELWSPMGMLRMLNIWKSTHRIKHSHEGHLWIKHIWVSFLPFSQPEVPQPEWSAAQNDMWSENTAPDSSGFISAKGC